MKAVSIGFVLAAILASTSPAYAYVGFGICNFGAETVASVLCYGPTILNATTVTSNVKVSGPLSANKSSTGSVTIRGRVNLKDSTIKGKVDIKGNLSAHRVKFENDIFISSNQTLISNSTVNGSIVINSKDSKSYLILQCGTKVAGSITFNGDKGWIQISDDSVIKGQVINATIEFIKRQCD